MDYACAFLAFSEFYPVTQFADVNAFLTLAATRHRIRVEEMREKPRLQEILNAAKDGKVPVHLVSSKSSITPSS